MNAVETYGGMMMRILTLVLAIILIGPPSLGIAASNKAYVDRCIQEYKLQRYGNALAQCRKAVEINPRDDVAWAWLGIVYVALGRRQDALAAFRRSLALNPNGPQSNNARQWVARLSQPNPAPPTAAPQTVAPVVTSLSELSAAAGRPRYEQAVLFGREYRKALVGHTCLGNQGTIWSVVYNLGRNYDRFEAVAGAADNQGTRYWVAFQVIGDGKTLFESQRLRSGDVPAEINVSARGVLRLELISSSVDYCVEVLWGDPRVIRGSGSVVPILVGSPKGPKIAYLAELTAAAGRPRYEQAVLFGREYRKALVGHTCLGNQGTTWSVVYNLGRNYDRFEAVAGAADNQGTRYWVAFQVIGDGKTLFESQRLRSGDVPAEINVSARGVLRLELISSSVDYCVEVLWGDPRVTSQ